MIDIKNNDDHFLSIGNYLVDFWASWCTPCRMMLTEIEKVNLPNVEIAKCDTDENGELALKYEIINLPCCILFSDGIEKARFTGYRNASGIENFIKESLLMVV